MTFPLSIHSDTITNSSPFILAHINGNTFGCLRIFHVMASLQKCWIGLSRFVDKYGKSDAVHLSDHFPTWGWFQNLDRSNLTIALPPPHRPKRAIILWAVRSIVTERNLHRFWKQGIAVTHPIRRAQTSPADFRWETTGGFQNLSDKGKGFSGLHHPIL